MKNPKGTPDFKNHPDGKGHDLHDEHDDPQDDLAMT